MNLAIRASVVDSGGFGSDGRRAGRYRHLGSGGAYFEAGVDPGHLAGAQTNAAMYELLEGGRFYGDFVLTGDEVVGFVVA